MDYLDISLRFEYWKKTLERYAIPIPKYRINKDLKFKNSTSYYGITQYYPKNQTYQISVSKHILGLSDKTIDATLVHELLHTIEGCMNHGPTWQSYADYVNLKFHIDVRTHNDDPNAIKEHEQMMISKYRTPKFIIKCNDCGMEHKVYRNSRLVKNLVSNPDRYVCSTCKGHLKVESC